MQLDYSDGYLLVSTLARSYICNTSLETFTQIGTKLRQGEYGGCFCRVNPDSSFSQATQYTRNTQKELDESLEDRQSVDQALSSSGKFGLSDCYEAVEEDQAYQNIKPDRENASGVLSTGVAARIFCARPGTRIWEADHSGKVLVTHQLKRALMVPPADVLLTDGSFSEQELLDEIDESPGSNLLESQPQYVDQKDGDPIENQIFKREYSEAAPNFSRAAPVALHPPVSVAFTKMLSFYSNYLLAISTYGLYIIDPTNSKVLLWISVSDSVTDVKVSGNTLIYKTGSGCIQNFMVTTVDIAILVLHTRNLPVECARLCLQNPEVFCKSELLSRLETKILTDLSNQIMSLDIKMRLQSLKALTCLDKEKDKHSNTLPSKSGVTYVKNDSFKDEEIKDGLSTFFKFSHQMFLPMSVTRWYSEPYLHQAQEERSAALRGTVSVENSPLHRAQVDKDLGSTSTYLQEVQSHISLNHFSSEDTLRSRSSNKSLNGCSTASHSSERKSSSPDPDLDRKFNTGSPTPSSGRCSQQSDPKSSHKSFESSLEMYEDPLFSSDNSSPDLEMATRIFLDSNQSSVNPCDSHNFYNLAYAPIHPGSEAATLLQDLMENVATNMVGTITSGTKNLTERLRSVTPLISSGDVPSRKSTDGSFSMLDMLGSNSNTDQEDQLQSSASGDNDQTDGFDTNIVIKTKPKKRQSRNNSGTVPSANRSNAVQLTDEVIRPSIELPGVVRNLHELVTSTVQQIINTDDRTEAYDLLTHWLEVYFSTVQQIQVNKRLSPQASEDIPGDGPVSLSSVDSSHSHGSGGTSCDSLHWDSNDIGFEPSAMSADILEQITELFLQCLQAGVSISSIYNTKIASGMHKPDILQHPLTPEGIKKVDFLYAYLISNDCGLLHYSNLLSALETLGQHYYILTWTALLEKITRDNDKFSNHLLPDIIPDLDFTRSQRVSFLHTLASSGNMKNFITAAAQIENPTVIVDVIFILNHIATQSLEIGCTTSISQSQKHLLQYLTELSRHRNLTKLYLNYWSLCPELQYDILSALLSAANPSIYSCSCGMPLPRYRPVALETLADTLLTYDILDAKNVSELCQSLGYWKGYCTISVAYNLQSLSQCFPYIVQNCNIHLLDDIMEVLPLEEFVTVFDTLADMTSEDSSVMKCYKCQNKINFSGKETDSNNKTQTKFEYEFQVNGEPHIWDLNPENLDNQVEAMFSSGKDINGHVEEQMNNCEISPEARVSNIGQLWETVLVHILRRIGSVETLKLLTKVEDRIPPGILSKR
ncbi:Hermansky-Pudlak syndrome 5 protein-like [Homarus americanus]|uniref:Hermansky-Pudlak syndrome 5 protein-like n=2 Tax=Homarus americanus TaxID=6706 RepID=A0A8J5JLG1_HOMAM|nr:Hermansky-Pudlak syndrome 5 protein-like [Homarus americanus]